MPLRVHEYDELMVWMS